jgi:hypothetical protein
MEIAMIAETEQIEFQALALNHSNTRDISDNYMAEVRLSGLWAQRSELWTIKRDKIFIVLMLVLKRLK